MGLRLLLQWEGLWSGDPDRAGGTQVALTPLTQYPALCAKHCLAIT